MALNVSRRNDHYLYSSDRIAQVMGCGLLTFVDRATGLDEFFSDEEVVFYSDEASLLSELDRHLRDDGPASSSGGRQAWAAIFSAFRHDQGLPLHPGTLVFERVDPTAFGWRSTA